MTEEEKIKQRLEYIGKRIERLEKQLYRISPAKYNERFKRYSNERGNLEIEMKRILDKLKNEWKK